MRAAERSVYKFAYIRRARMNFHSRKALVVLGDCLNVGKIKLRIYALRIHIQRNVYDVKVSCPFAVSKKAPFYAVSTGKQSKFALRYAFSAVIVVVKAYNYFVPVADMLAEIFN